MRKFCFSSDQGWLASGPGFAGCLWVGLGLVLAAWGIGVTVGYSAYSHTHSHTLLCTNRLVFGH